MNKWCLTLLLLMSQTVLANTLPAVSLNLGEQIKLENSAQSIYVRLPNGYHQSQRHYPVIYLLDADLFYMDKLFFHSIAIVDRLENAGQFGDIPQAIVVGIPFGDMNYWYRQTINEPKTLQDMLTKELPQLMKQKSTSDAQLKSTVSSVAYYYLKQQQFDSAFALYDSEYKPKHTNYTLNRVAQRFYNDGNFDAAHIVWKKLQQLSPHSEHAQKGLNSLKQKMK